VLVIEANRDQILRAFFAPGHHWKKGEALALIPDENVP